MTLAATAADGLALERFFEKSALIPAVIQAHGSGEVLMLAYMNQGALARTIEDGTTWFWSRSRGEYWHKGDTSGHVQQVRGILADCDRDTLLIKVDQTGAACHTGSYSCFFNIVC
ncbi:MAG: phosphoribosyl-AMP cyclohydrolase [Oscillospiraceae bacterium]|nr:phosphoribosyl-AMP cyclohydrolase [Oscillospiraceae bacterium]